MPAATLPRIDRPRSRTTRVLPPVETYFREVGRTPLLDAKEEQTLARRINRGDHEAREHMIRANLRLVINIARRFRGRGLDLDDLIAEGNLGLLHAIERFDPACGTRFSTYAYWWIRQAMQRAIKTSARTIRLPDHVHDLLARWRQTAAVLNAELGRPAEDAEIAAQLRLSPRKVRTLQRARRLGALSFQDFAADGEWSLDELLVDDQAAAAVVDSEEQTQVTKLLGFLVRTNPRQAEVLRLRFGLEGDEPMTLQAVGERLGLTRERVRQIETAALRSLSAWIEPLCA